MRSCKRLTKLNGAVARVLAAVVSRPALAVFLSLVAAAPALAGPVTSVSVRESNPATDGADVRLQGAANSDFGFTSVMGYLDGDRLADLVIGAPAEGRVYIFFGSVDNPNPNPGSPLLNASAADVILSPDPATTGSKLGFSVSIAPRRDSMDINNPLLIGAPGADASRGAAYVLPASAWLTVGTWNTPGTAVAVTSVPGAIRIHGINPGDEVGYSTAFGPVITSGGEDFVLGARRATSVAPGAGRVEAGVVYVVGQTTSTPIDLAMPGAVTVRRASGAVAGGGLGEQIVVDDFFPGGLHEVAASGVGVNPDELTNPAGRLYVFSVGGADIDLAAASATVRRIRGDANNDFFGFSLVSGDFDDNGAVDLVAGAIYAEPTVPLRNAGAVYLFSSADLSAPAAGADPAMDPAAEAEATLPTMRGVRAWDVAGFSLATGDVNGDGIHDLAIGSRWHERSNDINDVDAGLVSILHGNSGALTWPTAIGCASPLPCAAGNPANVDRMIYGNIFESSASDEMGFSVSLGDFNRDAAFDDVAIGTVSHERVYLISLNNTDEPPATVTGQATDALRDIRDRDDDGDGYLDGDEDANDNGVFDAGMFESDPSIPNRDGGVAFGGATPASVDCDQIFTATVTVSNNSPNLTIAASEARLRVNLPAEFVYQPGTTVCGATNLGGGPFPLASFTQVSASNLAPGASVTCQFQLRVAPDPDAASGMITAELDATITNELADGHPGIAEAPNMAARTIAFTCPDLASAKTGPAVPVVAGTTGTLDYSISVDNLGGTAACTSPRVVDTLPAGVTCATATGTGWSCTIGSGSVTCNAAAALAIGATAPPIALDCSVAPSVLPGSITNTATASCVSQSELDVDDSIGTVMTTVVAEANLSLSASDLPDPVAALDNVVYTFAVANAGPSDAQAVQLTITPPAGQVSATPAGTGWACAPSGPNFICTRAVLAPGAAPDVTMTTTVDKFQTTPITALASVTTTTTDPNLSNNVDSEMTTVLTRANLGIVKTDSPDPVTATANLTYTLAVNNAAGGTPAFNITVTDTLPAGVVSTTASGTGWTCIGAGTSVVTCTLPTLADGTAANPITIVAVPDANTIGSVSNTASVSAANNLDVVAGNNTDTEATTVRSLADLAIDKSDAGASTSPGASLVYTLAVTNNGPSRATGITVTDDLPGTMNNDVAFVSATGTGWTCNHSNGTVTCTLASLDSAASSTITLTVTVDGNAAGTLTNSATVAATDNVDVNNANDSDTETTVVVTAADLSISKADSADPVAAGGTLTYTLTVDNLGPDAAGDVTVTDMLPSGTTFVSTGGSMNWSCSHNMGTVTCTRGNLPDGPGPDDITITVNVSSTASGLLSNSATIAALNNTDLVAGNNSDTETTQVTTSVDLSITKSDSVDPVAPGGALTYTINVTNNSMGTASGVTVVDVLPAQVDLDSFTGTDWTCLELPAGTVTCTLGVPLATGAAPVLTLNTTVDSAAAGTQSNTATVSAQNNTDGTAGNNSDTETTGVSTATDLQVVKTGSVNPVSPGGSLTYTLAVTNNGPENAGDLVLVDTLPTGVTFASTTAPGWSCSHSAGVVTCTRNNLANGNSSDVDITVTVGAGAAGTLTNSATITAGNNADSVPGNNTGALMTTVATAADLAVVKTESVDPATENQNLSWTLAVNNNGSDAAAGVTVVDTLPAGVTFVSATGTGWSCMHSAGTVTCTRAAILPAATAASAITLTVTVDLGTAGPLSNTATVSASDNTDGTPGNDSDTETTAVNSNADLRIVKADSADPASAGGSLSYTLTVTNDGPSDAANLTVIDTLPAGVTFGTASGTGWSCMESAGTVTCTRAALLAMASAPAITIDVTIDAMTAGTLSNTASVAAADNTDTDPVDSSDTETTMVLTAADLAITKAESADPVDATTTLTWTIGVSNASATSGASGITVTDMLPAGVTFGSATGTGWSCMHAAGTVTCSLAGSLAPLTAANPIALAVTVDANTTGTLSNTASVAATNNTDGVPGNDSATETTMVLSRADLRILKSDDVDPVLAGGAVSYTLAVENLGPSDASGLTVVDTLPAGMTFVSATGTGWGCMHAAGTVTCTRASLAAMAAAPIQIDVTVDGGTSGTVTNTATVSAADNSDLVAGNDSDSENTTASLLAADLEITVTDSTDPIGVPGSVTYTISVENLSLNAAGNVVASVTLPPDSGVTFDSTTCSISSGPTMGVLTCNLGTVAAGSTEDFDVTIDVDNTVPDGTTLSLVAGVFSGTTPDSNPMNNTDIETTGVSNTLLVAVGDVDILAQGAVTWTQVSGALGYNLYRGDLGQLLISGTYTQDPGVVLAAQRFCGVTDMVQDDGYTPAIGKAVFYMVTANSGPSESSLGTDSAGHLRPNDNPCQ